MELVALLGQDKESWGQVLGLINHGQWDKVILVKTSKNEFVSSHPNTEEVFIDSSLPILEMKSMLLDKLKSKFSEFEAFLSIASGNGKEHMALISALLTVPVGIRLVVFTKKGIKFAN